MVVRVRQVTRTTQPQEAAGIDYSHPLRDKIIVSVPFGSTSIAGKSSGVVSIGANGGLVGSEVGLALNGGSAAAIASIPLDLSAYNAITVSALVYVRDITGADRMFWELTADGLANVGGFALYAASGGTKLSTGHKGDVGVTAFSWAGSQPANNVWTHVAVVYDFTAGSTTEMRLFINGVEKSATTWDALSENTSAGRFANSTLYFLNRATTSLPTDGMMAGFSILEGDQSAFIPSLAANPWQLFEPEQIIVPVASGTTAYTLTAATSAFTLTGTTTGLKAARKLATSVATFTETGNAAGLAVGRKLSATVSNFTLTGVAAALKADRKLAPSVSPYTFTGNDTTLTYSASGNKSITADVVSFALTGSNANLTVQRKLTSSVSAFTLTGNDSALSYQRKLPAGVGAFTLTGIDVALSTTGTELPPEQTKGGAGKAKIKKKRLKVQKRELDETLQQLIDDLTEDRNYQSSQEIIEEAVEELKENILDQIQPKELTKEEITEALVVTTVSLKLTAMEVSLSEKLDKITKELEKTNRYVQSLEELVILLNNT